MVGSMYESRNIKTKNFKIIDPRMRMTDDSLLTIAVAKTLMKHRPMDDSPEGVASFQDDLAEEFVRAWKGNDRAGFGKMFYLWCVRCVNQGKRAPAYQSFGNGGPMRISPVAWVAQSEEEVKWLSRIVTEITHDHPEGLKGAEAIALSVYLALHGATKEEIKKRMVED